MGGKFSLKGGAPPGSESFVTSPLIDLPLDILREELGMFLDLASVSALSSTCSMIRGECLHHWVLQQVERRHGLADRDRPASLAATQWLMKLEAIPISARVEHQHSVVVQGSAIVPVNVGGVWRSEFRSWGQIPPCQGDRFENRVALKKGDYVLCVRGGVNAHHGVLDLELNGERFGSCDMYSRQTENNIAFFLPFHCSCTGEQVIACTTRTKNAEALNFWQCLSHFHITERTQGRV